MLVDTTFLIDLLEERERGLRGPAHRWLARRERIWTTVVSVGELAVGMIDNNAARGFFANWRVVRLHPAIAYEAAAIERELLRVGGRLGENDNWIAAFARYYGEPLVSNDAAFDRVRGIRRVSY
jgi:predicted nucleic acid-binding protein